ncbi:potassium transporter Kup [Nitrosomonas sp. Is37]|uniref:potassium transporter Kup n=1 Tax=Nitrosomonas sp. Is37 TaxID=3080535 RepID=UPI00294AFA37|nr:potassium transporter Kup [Nitrosomonas sp. Is37]MDV6344052.1 potassium transporter Kup [Nitrosomonas sp. Is37]
MTISHSPQTSGNNGMLTLMVGAIGVVYGDIGTSPLYAMKEAFSGTHALSPEPQNILGFLSLVFWALTIVVSVKYVLFMMRADNKGEGGIMALIALTQRVGKENSRLRWLLASLGLFGAALFYGDGMITPAISVLSAVEGIAVTTPALESWIIPFAVVILVLLFLFQPRGTAGVGKLFGPVMAAWFLALALLGIINIIQHPFVLKAINPIYGLDLLLQHGWFGFLVLGTVVLAITGAEALYADMGHFGRRPIQFAWFGFVWPALLLNYFGQGALLMSDPTAGRSPFYLMAPSWALYPLIALATAATVIASQAVITGAFSVTRQAIQLGYIPRMQMLHTSEREIGQIYIPFVNWFLMLGVVALIVGFGSSSNLAAAYGIAVTGTMAIDTLLVFFVIYGLWRWHWSAAIVIIILFLVIDFAFVSANLTKVIHGGWFPLLIATVILTLLTTWKKGRNILIQRLQADAIDIDFFLTSIEKGPPTRVPGTAVFLTASYTGVPHALLHNLAHNKVLHEQVVLLTVVTADVPFIPADERIEIKSLGNGFYRALFHFGYMDEPDVPATLAQCELLGLKFNMLETSFFLSRETLISTPFPGMAPWREKLFITMARNASSAMTLFKIPANRVIELGTQVEL